MCVENMIRVNGLLGGSVLSGERSRTILGRVPLLALGFGSGHDLALWVQARVGAEAVWDSVSPSLSAPPLLSHSLSLSLSLSF